MEETIDMQRGRLVSGRFGGMKSALMHVSIESKIQYHFHNYPFGCGRINPDAPTQDERNIYSYLIGFGDLKDREALRLIKAYLQTKYPHIADIPTRAIAIREKRLNRLRTTNYGIGVLNKVHEIPIDINREIASFCLKGHEILV